jgi:prevent-host-death family protein
MGTINITEARRRLSRLIERVEAGEEFVITRSGRSVARLVPLERVGRPIKRGNLTFPREVLDNWNTLYEKEIEKMFYGRALNLGRKARRR